LDVIIQMDFPGYFLIVADFIKWAKMRGIPVGPGRGSGAGSVVAWSLTITDLDPLRFNLLFERFLNPERVSMPDFDIDFCQDRREEVIAYVQEKYGHDNVAQIITFGKLQARAVCRDVGRVLQMPYGQVDRLSKMIPSGPGQNITLAEAVEAEPRLKQAASEEAVVARMLEIGQKLEGLYRHASTHAAGVVIGDRPLVELVPLYRDPRSPLPVTQFNMKWVEQAGLVKFDFLGLKTLTVIETAVNLIRRRQPDFDIRAIGFDDEKTYRMLARGETVGVFQLESQGMRDVLRRMEADCIEDIIAIVALYRPGPMENIPKYCNVKKGLEEPDYPHPDLEPILKETYGIIVYQEQVMQIAQVLSGYSLGEADLLRRAMGKKIRSEMERQKARFVEGAVERGIERARAEAIYDLVAKFASYGFNKSHAACYAIVAWQTAWLKANHPVEFLAASMTLDMGNTDKLNLFAREAARLGIEIVMPDVNRTQTRFEVEDGRIVYTLSALKNVGQAAIEHLVEVREKGGPFRSLADFARRIDPHVINRRALEAMARAGAFDSLNPNRAQVLAAVDAMLEMAQRAKEERETGQESLFALAPAAGGGAAGDGEELPLPEVPPWPGMQKLEEEFAAVGFHLSGHPLDDYMDMLARIGVMPYAAFRERVLREGQYAARLAGCVTMKRERRAKTGNRYAFVGFSDPSGQFE
ncbi:MAG TPA: DNA polymerase III subunit alpha, partial [Thermopetrobacter sp.]|nr:DNA polymerase III subunit alpha [Thermopetrobacter sp.]